MDSSVDWELVAQYLDALYEASDALGAMFPGRKYTRDGHLVGSVGEVVAAYMFDLDLNAASTRGYDATSQSGREIEIKLTQGRSVVMRHEPEHLIALHRPKGGPLRMVYNGPGAAPWQRAGKMQSNGQRTISISVLSDMDQSVADADRLIVKRQSPI
jgi:hypothetical protein